VPAAGLDLADHVEFELADFNFAELNPALVT